MAVCFDTCVDSIRTIPVLQHDADRPEDVNTESEDHAPDEWRYACMSRPYIKTKPAKDRDKQFKDYVQSKHSEPAGDWLVY
jgi:nitrate reductase beta subunit